MMKTIDALQVFGESVAIMSLVVAAFFAGAYMVEEGTKLEQAAVEGKCRDERKFNAYVAKSEDGWHCFKENIDNKKLSRTAIVLEGL